MENGENIDVIEFVKARSREIEAIEKSITVSHKQSLLWQRLPYYKRRRNRNYDKRTSRKFTRRTKDRHLLRTHTFYAKRFFMLKLASFSIPMRRRLKSAKYIYKSQDRGFIFDESFRGGYVYNKEDIVAMRDSRAGRKDGPCTVAATDEYGAPAGGCSAPKDAPASKETDECLDILRFINKIDFDAEAAIQYIDNQYEVVVDRDQLIVVGRRIGDGFVEKVECLVSVMSKKSYSFDECKMPRVYKNGGREDILETYKILCRRSEIMMLFQTLSNAGFIPACLEEIHRLSLENDCMSIYDNVKSGLYAEIENASNAEVIAKYGRTPASKKQKYNLARLFLQDEPVERYFIFKVAKGACRAGAEVFSHEKPVGRVVRSAYKFSCGLCYGLGFTYGTFDEKLLMCKNLQQDNYYQIEITKYLS